MAPRTVEEATAVDRAVGTVLNDAGVAVNSPIRAALVHDSEVHDGMVSVCDPDGRSVSLKERLAQMRKDARYKDEFPKQVAAPPSRPPAATPAGAILTPTREQFAEISSGKAVVR